MQAKLIEFISKYLLIPFIMKGVNAIVSWFIARKKAANRKKDEKKRAKINAKKAEDHQNSSVDDSTDTFNGMP